MHTKLVLIIHLAFLITVCSCTQFNLKRKVSGEDIQLSEEYRQNAIKNEKSGNLQDALLYLRAASSIDPDNNRIEKDIEVLRKKIEYRTKKHIEAGKIKYVEGKLREAKREFLVALRYDPGNRVALNYLKKRLSSKLYLMYPVKNGDTFKTIASAFYGKNEMAFIVSEINGYDWEEKKPDSGSWLRLPIMKTRKVKRTKKIEKKKYVKEDKGTLEEARSLLKARDYESALNITNRVIEDNPENEEAGRLHDEICYRWGKKLHRDGRYFKALRVYNDISPGNRNAGDEISAVKKSMKKAADVHYQKGVEYLLENKPRKAILEWARALTLNPDHKNARKGIKKARELVDGEED